MPKSKTKVARAAPSSPSVADTSIMIKKEDDSKLLQSSKYPNVSFNRSTGRWQAWTNCMATKRVSRGPYVGQHTTEYLAARAQDRSLLKHRALATKLPIKLNFPEADYASDEKLRNALTNKEFIKLLKGESHACYSKVERTKCMQIFLAEEEALGNLPVESKGKVKINDKVTSLQDFLKELFMKRSVDVTNQSPDQAPMKQLWKNRLKKEIRITKIVDDLLCDDPKTENMGVVDPLQAPKAEKSDFANLLTLADVALIHEDLKPYEV